MYEGMFSILYTVHNLKMVHRDLPAEPLLLSTYNYFKWKQHLDEVPCHDAKHLAVPRHLWRWCYVSEEG